MMPLTRRAAMRRIAIFDNKEWARICTAHAGQPDRAVFFQAVWCRQNNGLCRSGAQNEFLSLARRRPFAAADDHCRPTAGLRESWMSVFGSPTGVGEGRQDQECGGWQESLS